jgi:hypothetical protein
MASEVVLRLIGSSVELLSGVVLSFKTSFSFTLRVNASSHMLEYFFQKIGQEKFAMECFSQIVAVFHRHRNRGKDEETA